MVQRYNILGRYTNQYLCLCSRAWSVEVSHGKIRVRPGGTRGSAIPYIVMKDLTRYKFLYEETVVKKFISIIRPMFKQMDMLKEECLFLARQRDLLLPRLMSGKLEVKV